MLFLILYTLSLWIGCIKQDSVQGNNLGSFFLSETDTSFSNCKIKSMVTWKSYTIEKLRKTSDSYLKQILTFTNI